jgi:ABC-type nitrate/sulfonate/bicarbonate transport system substrate-binding protein
MNSYILPQLLFATQVSDRSRRRLFFRKSLIVALTLVPFGFGPKAYAQPIKLGYAALTAGQAAPWMAKEGGYFSKYGLEAELIYIPAVAATQALIAGLKSPGFLPPGQF